MIMSGWEKERIGGGPIGIAEKNLQKNERRFTGAGRQMLYIYASLALD